MTNRTMRVAALCALLMLAKLHAQTGITDPKLRSQWEAEQQRKNSKDGSKLAPTATTKSKITENGMQMAERLGILRSANGTFAIKWHQSDVILAFPENTTQNTSLPTSSLGLVRDLKTRQDYSQYSFLMPNGKALAAIRTEIIPADSAQGVPELWLFRALNLTAAEYKMGSTALEAVGAQVKEWPSVIQTTTRPYAKELKLLEVMLKINESADSSISNNAFWHKTTEELTANYELPFRLIHGDVGLTFENTFAHNSAFAKYARNAPLASQLYLATLPYLNRLEKNPTDQERILILQDLYLLGESFFANYSSQADATYFANTLLFVESDTYAAWLKENPTYSSLRGQSKATYPYAQTVLQNSLFSDRAKYLLWLNLAPNDLVKKSHTDPVAQWCTRPIEAFKRAPYSSTAEQSNKEVTQVFYTPTAQKTSSLTRTITPLTNLLNSRAKQYRQADKNEKLPFALRHPISPDIHPKPKG